MRDKLTEQIETLIMPCIDDLSLELVELTVKHRGNTVVIDIAADRPAGGITIDECALINKRVDRAIEEKGWFGEDYVVEVSSPGLDRALKTSKDFYRALGQEVRIHLLEVVEGKVEHLGKIIDVSEDQISIKRNDNIVIIPLKHISKAVQVIE